MLPSEIVAGIATLVPLVIGYTMGVLAFIKFFRKKKTLILLSAFIFVSLVSSWIGVSLVFLAEVFSLTPPSDQAYVFSYAWAVPILATTWNYVTATLFKKRNYLKYIVLGVMIILDALFLYFVYIKNDFTVTQLSGIYKDSTFGTSSSIIVYIFAASVLVFIAPVYFWISRKTDEPLFKFKSIMIGIGSILFAIVAVLDGIIPIDNIATIIVIRVILTISVIVLFLGFTTPKRIAERFKVTTDDK